MRSLPDYVQQLDVVFDFYQKWSRKNKTREGFCKKDGARLSIKEKTPINRKFAKDCIV